MFSGEKSILNETFKIFIGNIETVQLNFNS